MITIVTDGACLGNPGPGGWAALVFVGDDVRELGGHERHTTNNQMELRAAIEGLRTVPADAAVRVMSDSTYVIQGITRWIHGWRRRDWLTQQGSPVEHRALWEELARLAGSRTRWEHVYGHSGHPANERANTIAQAHAGHKRVPPGRPLRAPTQTSQPAHRAVSLPKSTARRGSASYLSLVGGTLRRDTSWEACKARVHGVAGARYKKCRSPEEEQATLASWGLSPHALA